MMCTYVVELDTMTGALLKQKCVPLLSPMAAFSDTAVAGVRDVTAPMPQSAETPPGTCSHN